MSIGPSFKGAAVGAVLGPSHSPLFPNVLWSAWLDGTGAVLEMTGLTVSHDLFEVVGDAVVNTDVIDGGVCPATVPTRFGLMDTAAGDALVAWAPVVFADGEGAPVVPVEGDPLAFAAGALTFTYTEAV